jgi:4-amino-4-deoxy-L-arabinose transferase-like glycosyltransferase
VPCKARVWTVGMNNNRTLLDVERPSMIGQSHFQHSLTEKTTINPGRKVLFLGIFAVYLLLRLIAWRDTVLVEDHDSLVYLDQIKTFRTFDLEKILRMERFTTQFYPFCASLLSWPGWSAETSARLCSMIFSSLLFLSVLGIGKRMAGAEHVAFGLTILVFSPVLIPFSFSILAEPTYVALIYTGFWVFWTQYRNPEVWKAGLLGGIFGLAFLTRIEGLLNLFTIPFLQGVLVFLGHRKEDSLKRLVVWTTAFAASFSLLVGLQIWRVSHKFGYFAIDERQVWTVARQILDGKSYEEQMSGLNFSSSQINLDYIRAHPELQARAASTAGLKEVVVKSVKTIVFNLDNFYGDKLNVLLGPLGLLFFSAGLFKLFKSTNWRDGFLVSAFIVFNLVGPLLYQVQIRYIAVVFPLMMLVEGIGIVYLAQSAGTLWQRGKPPENALRFVFLTALVAAWALPLYWFYASPKTFNGEYSPDSLREPARIVKSIAQNELLRPPIVSARKGYFIHYADAEPVAFPYTNMEGLTKFCELNKVDFLFVEYRHCGTYPFLETLAVGKPPAEFVLLYRGADAFGQRLELYRFQKG